MPLSAMTVGLLRRSLLRCLSVVRPTLVHVFIVNRRIELPSPADHDPDEQYWKSQVSNSQADDRGHSLRTLLSIYESDLARIRGIESKTFGIARIISVIFAANVAMLTLVARGDINLSNWTRLSLALAIVYLVSSAAAVMGVARPGIRHVLAAEDIMPQGRTAGRLARYSRSNRQIGMKISNLADAVVLDAGRSAVLTILTLVLLVVA